MSTILKIYLKSPANMQPADQISIDVVYNFAPIKTSGGRYHNVTTCKENHQDRTLYEIEI